MSNKSKNVLTERGDFRTYTAGGCLEFQTDSIFSFHNLFAHTDDVPLWHWLLREAKAFQTLKYTSAGSLLCGCANTNLHVITCCCHLGAVLDTELSCGVLLVVLALLLVEKTEVKVDKTLLCDEGKQSLK